MSTNRATGNKDVGNKEMQSDERARDQQAADAAFSDEGNESSDFVSQLQRVQEDVRIANDRALRAQAELENFRKRTRREMDEERRYAAKSLISDLLPVIDNLDRAIAAASDANQAGGDLLQGVRMVQSQFLSTLEHHHCRRVGSVGETFDPAKHQAIAQEASAEHPAGSITRVTQFGYQLHDRVVRPAQVFVSTGANTESKKSH
jgi:molecular chaperone GrpE